MARRGWLILLALCFVATTVVAQQTTSSSQIRYTPLDYAAIMRQLERASQPTLWQRLTRGFSNQPEKEDKAFNLSGNIGIGYSQEASAMVVASGVAQYALAKGATPSHTSLTAMVSLNGFYRLQASGKAHLSAKDRIEYNLGCGVMPIRFWGLGYEAAEKNTRSKYTRNSIDLSAEYIRKIVAGLSLGCGVDYLYATARDIEPLAESYLLSSGITTTSAQTLGFNLMAEYDGRRFNNNLTSGYLVRVKSSFHPQSLGDHSTSLWHIEAAANYFQPVWRGGMIALDLYADMWSWNTPWLFWAKMGGESRMRGYYYGKYTDRKMATAQLELRQTIFGPISGVVWGGAGSVFASHRLIDLKELLPNYGVGIRVGSNGTTSLRIDYGFGRHSSGLVININEAF